MSFYALLLVLAACFTHAGWNYLSKQANGKTPFTWLIYCIAVLLYLPFIMWQLSNGDIVLSWLVIGVALVGAILRLAYFVLLQSGYRKADISVVYPLAHGSGPILATAGAIMFMGEKPTVYSLAGLLLIITGVLVITRLKFATGLSTRLKTGLFYGVGTGFFIGCYTVWDKLAVSGYSINPLLLIYVSNIFGAVILAPSALNKLPEVKREFKQHLWPIIAIATLSPLSYLLILKALQAAPLIYVAPARELSILLGILISGAMINKEDGRRRAFASAFMAVGIACLVFG